MQGRGFYYPTDCAIGEDGKLYVVNRTLETVDRGVRVTMCDADSQYFGTFGSFGQDPGQFMWPSGVAIDRQGRVYVSDEHSHRISRFDASGAFIDHWGVHGDAPDQLDGPSGIALDAEDNLLVSDTHHNRILRFTGDGRILGGFGTEGPGDGQFNLPWGLTTDTGGNIYVADWGNDRIQKFSPDGELLASFGLPGRGDGQFRGPSSVAVDERGYIYVADWGNERVQVLDSDGRFVMKLRGEATLSKWAHNFYESNVEEFRARATADLEPKLEYLDDDPHEESAHIEKYFWSPMSVTLDGAGRLYVIESNRHRIQIYTIVP